MLTEKQAIQDAFDCHWELSQLMKMLKATAPSLMNDERIGELITLMDLYLAAVDGNLDALQYAVSSLSHHLSKNSP